eukprot:4473709-Prymnesium_polylepis.3
MVGARGEGGLVDKLGVVVVGVQHLTRWTFDRLVHDLMQHTRDLRLPATRRRSTTRRRGENGARVERGGARGDVSEGRERSDRSCVCVRQGSARASAQGA